MFRIATYNIHFGGVGRVSLISRVLETINADVVLIVEASDDNVLREIGYTHKMFITQSIGKKNHLAILSKTKPLSWENFRPKNYERALLKAEFLTQSGNKITLYGCHLQCHYFRKNEIQRVSEIEKYLQYIKANSTYMNILLGDFNAVAPNDQFDKSTLPLKEKLMVWWEKGKIYRDAIAKLQLAGYIDCFRIKHPDEDGFTLPTTSPQVRIDYIFANSVIANSLVNCFVVTSPLTVIASDHYPIVAEFAL